MLKATRRKWQSVMFVLIVSFVLFGTSVFALVPNKARAEQEAILTNSLGFADNRVIVTLTKEATLNGDYDAASFSEVGATLVEDLTDDSSDWVRKKVAGEVVEAH